MTQQSLQKKIQSYEPQSMRKRESIEEFKAKLVRLVENKSNLEDKMKEFEFKIRQSNSRLNGGAK